MSKTTKSDAFNLLFGELTESEIKSSKLKFKVAKAIYLKRKELNLTQEKFAELLGVSQGMVSKWENFDYNFTIEAMAEIFNTLGIEMDIKTGIGVLDYVDNAKAQVVSDSCGSKFINGWVCQSLGKLTYIQNGQAEFQKEVAS